MSLPDIQAISKKAIVESLKARYHTEWFQEDGPTYPIEVSVHTDHVTVQVDTSGAGLNRRGYRTLNAEAPIRETLAAALVILSPYRGAGCFVDPLCGSGTIAIEAAMLALNMAPGLKRAFAAERWPQIRRVAWLNAREEAIDAIRRERLDITGSDIDPKVLELARFHAQQAGLAQDIRFVQRTYKTSWRGKTASSSATRLTANGWGAGPGGGPLPADGQGFRPDARRVVRRHHRQQELSPLLRPLHASQPQVLQRPAGVPLLPICPQQRATRPVQTGQQKGQR